MTKRQQKELDELMLEQALKYEPTLEDLEAYADIAEELYESEDGIYDQDIVNSIFGKVRAL